MPRLKIALRVDSLGLGAKAGIVAAGDFGLEGVELNASHGDTTPEGLSRTGRREVMRFVSSRKLQVCALNSDIGVPFTDARRADEIAERMHRIVELAVDLGTHIVVAPAVSAPEAGKTDAPAESAPRLANLGSASAGGNVAAQLLADLAGMAANYDRFLAVRTGLNDGATMAAFLGALGDGAKAALDPAALLMGGFDPAKTATDLGKRVVHVYARDAQGPASGRARFTPLGEGKVVFPEVIAALDGLGYDGFSVVEAVPGQDPLRSVEASLHFLRKF